MTGMPNLENCPLGQCPSPGSFNKAEMAAWYSVGAQVELDDGRIWKRHVNDVLQNNSNHKTNRASHTSSN